MARVAVIRERLAAVVRSMARAVRPLMGGFTVYATVWQMLAVPLNGAVQGVIAALMAYLRPTFQVAVPAYLIIMLLIAAWGADETAFPRFFKQLWLAVIIYTLATNAEAFGYYVSGLVTGIEGGISNTIAGNVFNGAIIGTAAFDTFQIKLYSLGGSVLEKVSFYSPKTWVNLLVVYTYWLFGTLSIFLMFVEYLASYCIQQVLIAFGPLFVACYFFPFTRRYFEGWLSVAVASILTQIFVVGLLSMFLSVMTMVVTGVATATGTVAAGQLGSGNTAGQALLLLIATFCCTSFAALAVFLAYVAAKIAGAGFHSEWRQPLPFRSSQPEPSHPTPQTGGSAPEAADPDHTYAFNRTVGSAP
jgi:type IV secretory pathway VirB6-like protein